MATPTKYGQFSVFISFIVTALFISISVALKLGDIKITYLVFVVAVGHIVIAWPFFYLCNSYDKVNLQTSLLLGFIVGAVPISFLLYQIDRVLDQTLVILICGVLGAVSGLVFWISLRFMHDKTASS